MAKASHTRSVVHFPLQTYIDQLLDLFRQSLNNPNPALFLYRHDARTPLFMAESLARLLNSIFKHPETARALKLFKKLEDLLGRIDEEDHWVKHFSPAKSVRKKQLEYFVNRRNKTLEKLNKRLRQKDFYLQRFQELFLELEIDFNDAALISKIEAEIKSEIDRSFEFYKSCAGKLRSMELQVHELRRKLRWISIYAQSLQGIIVLKRAEKRSVWEKELVTKREMESPYHQLKIRRDLHRHIVFNGEAFYALGFVIRELGLIKDRGMAIESFARMLRKTVSARNPERLAIEQLKLSYTMASQLKKADKLLNTFFVGYRLHEKLI